MSLLFHLNYILFQDINAPAGSNSLLDAVMIFCANWLIFFFPLVLLIEWGRPLSWYRRPLQPGEAAIVQGRRAVVLWVAFACVLAYIFNLIIEQFVFEPRPFISHHVHLLVAHAADASFPSDHLAWSFAVVGMLALQFFPAFMTTTRQRRQGLQSIRLTPLLTPFLLMIVALVMACLIGIARIFVGVHYPGDILGGAIDGLIAACVITALRQWFAQPTNAVIKFAHTLHLA